MNPLVVGGDFNAYFAEVAAKLELMGYHSVIQGTTFPRSGRQLDGIFTNAIVTDAEITDVGFSDH